MCQDGEWDFLQMTEDKIFHLHVRPTIRPTCVGISIYTGETNGAEIVDGANRYYGIAMRGKGDSSRGGYF